MSVEQDFTVARASASEEEFADVFQMLLELHREGGYAPLDTDKAIANCYATMNEAMTFIARDARGRALGTLALTELGFWYSEETFLQDAWTYVRPEHRVRPGHRGASVGRALKEAARAEGDAREKIVFLTINNPDRRQKKTTMSIEAQIAGFVPLGYTMKIR